MSFSQIDHELEEKLNDIDEFIQSQLGLEDLDAGGPLPETETKELNCFLGTRKFLYGSPLLNNPGQHKLSVEFERCLKFK